MVRFFKDRSILNLMLRSKIAHWFLLLFVSFLPIVSPYLVAQAKAAVPVQNPAQSVSKTADYSTESYVIQKYSTDITYAADGTGERLITVQVKIQSDSAVRQFGVLEFPYEGRNEHVDFVYVRVHKPDGSVVATADTEAQDQPAEVTRQAPFYSDLRTKQLPVKSLSVGDQLEYQVRQVRTVASAPGHFWYTQKFVTNAVVLEETASLTVPKQKYVQVESATIKPEVTESGDHKIYRWKTAQLEKTKVPDDKAKKPVIVEQPPSIAVTTFKSWEEVGRWYSDLQKDRVGVTSTIQAKANELTKGITGDEDRIAAIYTYVSTQYRYIGVAFGIGRYQPHTADDVMQNQYGDCKDKHTLLASLLKAEGYDAWPVLVGSQHVVQPDVPSPGQFDHVMTAVTLNKSVLWMDSTPEVAPFRLLFSGLRDKLVLAMPSNSTPVLMKTPANAPFDCFVKYEGKATLASDGTLAAHFDISVRGDEELLYRIGFHQTPRMQWQTLVQNVSYATGFAGTVSNVDASSPEQLAKPFHYSYDYARNEYADWANRRILALMPIVAFSYGEDDAKPVDTILLGGPVTYTFHSSIRLPESYTAELPSAAKIETDFAEYSATYSQTNGTLAVDRSLKLKQREIPIARWDEYIKFEKAVQGEAGAYIQLIGAGVKQPGSQSASNPEAARLVQQAYVDIRDRNFDSARDSLDKAKAINATEIGLWSDYGYLYLSQNKREDGIAAYRKEIENHPENFDVYNSLAMTLSGFNRNDEAIEVLKSLLKADPHRSDARFQLGAFLMHQKRFAEAVPVLEEAVAQSPEDTKLKLMLGIAEFSGGAQAKGVELLRATTATATDVRQLNAAAYTLAEANMELPLSQALCEKALKILDEKMGATTLAALTDDDIWNVPVLAATWDTMAWILYREQEYTLALGYSRAAWALNQRPTIGTHLGQIYEKLHRQKDAIDAYQLALAAGYGDGDPNVYEAQIHLVDLKAEMDSKQKRDAVEELGKLRSISVPVTLKKVGSADFFVLFSANRIDDVQFLKGDEALKPDAEFLRRISFEVPFPPSSAARIVRRGIFYCSQVLKDCQFTMLPPETTRRN